MLFSWEPLCLVLLFTVIFLSGLLENCCIVLPGKRLLSRDVDGCLFQDQLLTVIQVCRRLQLGPGFSQKVFVKTLCKDVRVKVMFLHRPVCLWNCTKGGFCEILGNRHIAYILLDLGFFRPAYCRLLVAFIFSMQWTCIHFYAEHHSSQSNLSLLLLRELAHH